MSKVEVYDSSILSGAIVVLHNSNGQASAKCQEGIAKARAKAQEAEEELIYSQGLLQEAIIEEARCLREVHHWERELAAALAAYPPNPAYVSYCQAMLTKAQIEYEKAVAHRHLMEERVELVQQAVSLSNETVDTLIMRFNYSESRLQERVNYGCSRLQAAHEDAVIYSGKTMVTKSGPTVSAGKKYTPNSYVEVDGYRYRTDDNGNIYQKKNPETGIYEGLPNTTYQLNGYNYKTDGKGRIVSAGGTLKAKAHEGRPTINDDVKGMTGRDEKGHLIGDQFEGSNLNGNLVAMDFDVNRSDYKKMEEKLAKYVNEYGKKVDMKVDVKYKGNSDRPTDFIVKYTVDGETFKETFKN